VLALSPAHPLALEYLDAAGFNLQAEATGPIASVPESDDSRAIQLAIGELRLDDESLQRSVELVRERRFEEALTVLYAARASFPRHAGISRSIQAVKQRLVREYRMEVGDLGAIPAVRLEPQALGAVALSDDEAEILGLLDGIVTFEDVIQSSTLGVLHSLRVLAQLLRRNVIERTAAQARVEPGEPATQPHLRLEPGARVAASRPLATFRVPEIPAPSPMLRIVPDPEPSQPPGPPAAPPPPAPDPQHTALVAQAIAAYIRGEIARARELLDDGLAQIPEHDVTSRRDLERLSLRLDKETP